MSTLCPTRPASFLHVRPPGDEPLERRTARVHEALELPGGDALLVEWGERLDGLYALLAAAEKRQRVLFPARWLAVRSVQEAGCGDEGRLLAVARNDAALQRLFGEAEPELGWGKVARPDEPLALLGVAGDVVSSPGCSDPVELRRRACFWMHRLGVDHVAMALPAGASEDHPLMILARERQIPLVTLIEATDPMVCELPSGTLHTPFLWADFQLDLEHRLPDDGYVSGLRDLLLRGSLLRERVLFERLPEDWREQADAELRALYLWQVSPLLRRVAALLQTLLPVEGLRITAPLPTLEGVCAYLLGLTDQRPHSGLDPATCARHLASGLHEFDRCLRVEVPASAWPRLQARLASWVEGGHLASCSRPRAESAAERRDVAGRHFCFSGQPLWLRTPLRRDADGVCRVDLSYEDRRALGWFELELIAGEQMNSSPRVESALCAEDVDAAIRAFPFAPVSTQEQLNLDLDLELEGYRA